MYGGIIGASPPLDGVVIFIIFSSPVKKTGVFFNRKCFWLGDLGTIFGLTSDHFIYKIDGNKY